MCLLLTYSILYETSNNFITFTPWRSDAMHNHALNKSPLTHQGLGGAWSRRNAWSKSWLFWLCEQYGAVLYCTALHCTALHCTALHRTAPHRTAPHRTVLYCTVLYCTVLYCTVLYCTVLTTVSQECLIKKVYSKVTCTSVLSYTVGGGRCHLRVVPPGQLLRRPSTPKPSSNQVLLFFWREVFCVCFPVVFALRLLCLFSNSFQFKFFIYSLYIHIYIFYIFFHCTCGALQCSHGLWSLCRASSRWQTRSPAVGALWVYS